jgi:DedD protein
VNDILKQRLVGALILVALGVVFWPIIFVEPGDEAGAQQTRIPPRPEVATTPIEVPDLAGLRASPERTIPAEMEPDFVGDTVEDVPVEQDTVEEVSRPAVDKPAPAPIVSEKPAERTRSEPPQKLALDADGVPVAWILQVASVSSADKADQLRQRLLKMNQKAYVKKVQGGGKVLYRVYIGPKFERTAMEAIKVEIDAEFGVKSMIARYFP